MKLREVIEGHVLESELLDSVEEFDFDIDTEYPGNLSLEEVEKQEWNEGHTLWGNEYLETTGEIFVLKYNLKETN